MMTTEFDIIKKYFAQGFPQRNDVILGVGDDAALCSVPDNMQLVTAVDTLISGVHFPEKTSPQDIAYKALAVNLSDLAAMGAKPAWMTLALTCPQIDEKWLINFSQSLRALAETAQISLIGGDTTQGYLSVTIQVMGFLPKNTELRRQGAQIGDSIYVTGSVGDAGLGLLSTQGKVKLPDNIKTYVEFRLNRPTPRLQEGEILRNIAHSAIDISDGLIADLGHILKASDVGASIYLNHLPLSNALQNYLSQEQAWQLALSAGDDYELCFTVPAHRELLLKSTLNSSKYTKIGSIESAKGLRCLMSDGKEFVQKYEGYQHFTLT